MGTNLSRKELESNQVKMRNSASGKSEHQLNSAVASQGDFFCEGSIYLDMLRFLKIPSLTFIIQQSGNLLLQPVFKSISLFFFNTLKPPTHLQSTVWHIQTQLGRARRSHSVHWAFLIFIFGLIFIWWRTWTMGFRWWRLSEFIKETEFYWSTLQTSHL